MIDFSPTKMNLPERRKTKSNNTNQQMEKSLINGAESKVLALLHCSGEMLNYRDSIISHGIPKPQLILQVISWLDKQAIYE